jgi:D-3-phosphoglycerate dehydrogenase
MVDTWEVLLPPEIDPSGPESIADIARCTGMDEYESVTAALEDIARYDAVIVRTATLDESVIERADNLKIVAKHGAGLDNVAIEAASARGIVVCNTPGANARSVGEHAIALLFAVRRNLLPADDSVRAGEWDRAAFTGRELTDNTLGLFGFGAIAREVADVAQGLGMDVLTYDPYVPDDEIPARVERFSEFDELFEHADAVSVHVPLTDQTRGAISSAQLAALGPEGVLLNTSRGAVVEEGALVEALETGSLAGAGLDTFETEPPGPDNPLYDREDVVLTPHVGGVTDEALARMSTRAATNVRRVYDGELPESTVNRDALTEGGSE